MAESLPLTQEKGARLQIGYEHSAIVTYFTPSKGSGNKNTIGERRTIVINDNPVVVAGFYTFTRMVEGKATPAPSRFTMLITKRGDEWRIAHHRSAEELRPLSTFAECLLLAQSGHTLVHGSWFGGVRSAFYKPGTRTGTE